MSDRATRTTLALGAVEAPIALYRTFGDKRPEITFDTAGPNGGKLWTVPMVEVDQAVAEKGYRHGPVGDPLAETEAEDVEPDVVDLPGPTPGHYVQVLTEEGTGLEVRKDDVHKGVRLADGSFIDLTEQLAGVDRATKLEEMRVEGFIDTHPAGLLGLVGRTQGSYFIAPEGSGYTLALLHRAMIAREVAAVVRWTKRTRQSLGVIVPAEDGLLLVEVAWQALVRPPREEARSYAEIPVRDAHLEMAMLLIEEMTELPAVLDRLDDDAVAMKAELRERALAGEIPPVPGIQPDDDPLSAQLAESLA